MAENPAAKPGLLARATNAAKAGINTAAVAVAAKGGAVTAIHGLGFGKAGIVSKTFAAAWQSSIAAKVGGVVAGSPFATAQSVGATTPVITPIGVMLIGTAVAVSVGPAVYRACRGYSASRSSKACGGADDCNGTQRRIGSYILDVCWSTPRLLRLQPKQLLPPPSPNPALH
ncbi:interferon-induced 6-16 family [Haematococcus lacustris]|uniref:Interferon-induced 6-16 family n=1 Tax=Haematococcus lacustris TaxID=44745 RepID=A0A699Z953_HAELA|nr:interferon-induced 6-16 family [Haematococcus lacustris]